MPKNCIICGDDITGINQPFRCVKCYCNPENDKKVQEYISKI